MRGVSHRGRPYTAADPGLDAWVHNALTDSFLTAYRFYGAQACPQREADRYVAEQTRVGRLLGADPVPETAAGLTTWVTEHRELGPSPGSDAAIRFLRRPPLPFPVLTAYGLLFRAAVATLPTRICRIIGVRALPGDVQVGRAAVTVLRGALGASPDWQLALFRTGAPTPPGVRFRQPRRLAAPPRQPEAPDAQPV